MLTWATFTTNVIYLNTLCSFIHIIIQYLLDFLIEIYMKHLFFLISDSYHYSQNDYLIFHQRKKKKNFLALIFFFFFIVVYRVICGNIYDKDT